MRALLLVPVLLCTLGACSGSAPLTATPPRIGLRVDTTLAAYLGAPVTPFDSGYFGIVVDPLIDLHEPTLRHAAIPPEQTVMRFTLVRSFYPTIIVRIMDLGAVCRIVTTIAHPRGWALSDFPLLDSMQAVTASPPEMHPAKAIRRDSTDVERSVCLDVAAHVERAGLTPRVSALGGGLDGSDWLIERADSRGHVARLLWSPNRTSARSMLDAGVAFLRAAKVMPVRPEELY